MRLNSRWLAGLLVGWLAGWMAGWLASTLDLIRFDLSVEGAQHVKSTCDSVAVEARMPEVMRKGIFLCAAKDPQGVKIHYKMHIFLRERILAILSFRFNIANILLRGKWRSL